jgi:hypothetical protein
MKPIEQQPIPQAQPQALNKTTKLPSVKPPPPSTKIPKSAVIMPDGNTNACNLDVQFGLDFGQDMDNKKDIKLVNPPPIQQAVKQTQQVINTNDYLLNDKRVNTVAPTPQSMQQQQQQVQNVNKPTETINRPQVAQKPAVVQQHSVVQNINPVAPLIQQQQHEIVNATKNLDLNKNYNEQAAQNTSKPMPQQQQFPSNQSNSNIIYNTSIQQQQHAHQYKPAQQIPTQQKPFNPNEYNTAVSSNSSMIRDKDVGHMNVSPSSNLVQQKNLLQQQQPVQQQQMPLPNLTQQQQNNVKPTAPPAGTMPPPPPGVNVMNNPYLMSMPFVYYEQSKNPQQKFNSMQNLPYFDQNQFELMYSLQSQLAAMPQQQQTQLPASTVTQTAANYTSKEFRLSVFFFFF